MIRDFVPDDIPSIEAMHKAQGFAYRLPDLTDDLWITRKVLTNASGEMLQAVLARLTAEAFLIQKPDSSSPAIRMRRLLALQSEACEAGREAGLDSVHIWLEPKSSLRFGSQLLRIGWEKTLWDCYLKRL